MRVNKSKPTSSSPVIADLIRNPEGWRTRPSFPRRRETTGRQGHTGKQEQHQPYIPSPLMGEESKVRVNQPLTLGPEGEQDNTNQFPLSLDGRGIKGEGEINTHAHVTDCTRNKHPYPNQPTINAYPYPSMLNPPCNAAMPLHTYQCQFPHPVDTALKPV